jgi:hypothetical protein
MSLLHDCRMGERIALAWHYLGIFTSLFFCLFTVVGVILLEPLTQGPPPFGVVFKAVYFWGAITAFIAAAGVFWHLWAARQHKERLRQLEVR